MNDNREKLSAFLDDDLGHDENLQICDAGDDTLLHYSLIGDAMRGDVNPDTMLNVSAQVHQAIASETVDKPVVSVPPVAARPEARTPWFDFSSWLQPIGGLAIAASVAMIVVVSLDQPEQAGDTLTATQVATQAPAPAVSVDPVAVRAVASTAGSQQPDINLDQYLEQHSEFAASDTLQGRLPYVRAVGYKSE